MKRSGKKQGSGGRGAVQKIYLDRVRKIFGVNLDMAERLTSLKLKSSIRINVLSPLDQAEIMDRLAAFGVEMEPIPWCPGAYHLLSDKRALAESELFQGGHVYIQNASSLIPGLAMNPQVGDRILDVCAAPGGKTAHIQALAKGQADIMANDAMKPRLAKLQEVLSTFHIPHTTITNFEGQFIDRHVEGLFDRILLDAQCSGEGMLDLSHGGALRFWSEQRVIKMSYLQQKMLAAAWKVLKPGGVLIYSTCTFGPEENEGPVSRHLKHNDDAQIEPIDLDVPGRLPGLKSWQEKTFSDELRHAVRISPSPFLEGFFVCRLKKKPI